jgi:hypothetical protein
MSARPVLLALVLAAVAACDGGGDRIGAQSGARLEADPTSMLFPATPMGESATRTVVLRHTGTDGFLHLGEVSVVEDSAEFTVSQPAASVLAVGAETTFTVTFSPADDVPDTVHVAVEHDSALMASPLLLEVTSGAPNQALVALPFELDFGPVRAGGEPELSVRFQNLGTRVVHVESVALYKNSSPDFAVTTDAYDLGLPRDVAPDDVFDVRVRYRPSGGDAVDTGLLQVVSTEHTLEATVDVRGRELAPDLVVSPDALDFGPVFLHAAAQLPVTLTNQGDVPLEVSGLELADPRVPWLSLPDAPATPTSLDVGASLTLHVRFAPSAPFEATTDALATLRISSDDPDTPFAQVPVRGEVRLPRVTASPVPLDFGRVAPGDTRTRDLLLLNNSRPRQAVTVLSVVLTTPTGEYALDPGGTFGPAATPPQPAAIAAGEAVVLPLTFTNQGGPADEPVDGTVTLTYDLADEPPAEVPLTAVRAAGRDCLPALQPDLVDFGVVPQGDARTRLFVLRNEGSGTCRLEATDLAACATAGAACDAEPAATPPFALDDEEPVPGLELGAGQQALMPVTFTPPTAPHATEPLSFAALASATLVGLDGAGPALTTTADGDAPNLRGATGPSCLVVSPDSVGFGDVRVGCAAPLKAVHAHNRCTAPLHVTALELTGCDAEFRLVNVPYLPFELTQANQMNLKLLTYAPVDLGADGCALVVRTDEVGDPAYVVPLDGRGTLESHVRETFVQTGGRAVDILFVVDNSGSMTDNQANLAANFGTLAAIGEAWQSDVHLGVTTTDMTLWGEHGALVGDPKVLTRDTWNLFGDHVKVGAGGSGTEMGLAAAAAALSWPLAADSGDACTDSASCGSTYACVDGGCGGPNRGFLRDYATLHVVFVSDEEDQSSNTTAYYLDVLRGLKGEGHDERVQVHAVVGLPSTSGAGACAYDAGTRYLELAKATGGVTADICNADWAAKLQALGNAIFGLVREFPLLRTPDPTTLTVTVAGKPCTAGWTLDPATNRLVFDPDGPCMPEHDDEIVADYDVYCYRY